MGFDDKDYQAAVDSGISQSQLYKQAGNSIVVDVLFYIFLQLYEAMPELFDNLKVCSMFSGLGAFEKALDRLYDAIDASAESVPTVQALSNNSEDINYAYMLNSIDTPVSRPTQYVLKMERTEYAKKIRKAYEAGRIKEKRRNLKEYAIREDGCSNTLTTVQKDNYVLELPTCAALRGRETQETSGYSQQLELNFEGTTNALTTVQKDNLIIEPQK